MMVSAIRSRIFDYVNRNLRPVPGSVSINRRRIYILPSRFGLAYTGLLFALLLGALNYANSLLFLLCFLLAAFALTAMMYTHRNLAGLVVSTQAPLETFAGGTVDYRMTLSDQCGYERPAVLVEIGETTSSLMSVPAAGMGSTVLKLAGSKRGRYELPRLLVVTQFPSGLFRAWTWIEFDAPTIIYPRPAKRSAWSAAGSGEAGKRASRLGDEDFVGLRDYQAGDSPRNIAWKAVAHSGELKSRQMAGTEQPEIWLDYDDFPHSNVEERLSLLARAVLQCEAQSIRYGLRIPGTELRPANGAAQRQESLRALALFGIQQ